MKYYRTISEREKEVLQLISDEYSTKEIAHHLFLSFDTVKTHRKHLMEKLGTKNSAGLVREGFRLGILTFSRSVACLLILICTIFSSDGQVNNDHLKNIEWRTRSFTISNAIPPEPTIIFEARLDTDDDPNNLFGTKGTYADHCVGLTNISGIPPIASRNQTIICLSETGYDSEEEGPFNSGEDVDFHFRSYFNITDPRCEFNENGVVGDLLAINQTSLQRAFQASPTAQTASLWTPFIIGTGNTRIDLESTWRYTNGNTFDTPLDFGTLSDGNYDHYNSNRLAPPGASAGMGYTNNNFFGSQNQYPDVFYQFDIGAECKQVTLRPLSAHFTPYTQLYLRTSPTTYTLIESTDQSMLNHNLYEGEYLIIIESTNPAQGPFNLNIEVEDISSNPLGPGSITASSTAVCAGSNLPTINNSASGTSSVINHSHGLTYEWEKKIGTSNWNPVFGESGASLSNTGTMGMSDIQFRRRTKGCDYTSSWTNIVTIPYTPGSITGGSIDLSPSSSDIIPEIPGGIDPGSINNITSATGDPAPLTYLWQQSTNNGASWTSAPGSNTSTGYNIPNITQTTRYRRQVSNGCGGVAYSNEVVVVVIPADGAISGRVTSPASTSGPGAGVPGVTVTAVRTTSVPGGNLTSDTYTALTNVQGYYTISNIYFGDDQADFTITPSLNDGGIIHVFDPASLDGQTLQATFNQLSNKDFVDETTFSFSGNVHHIYGQVECGVDSAIIFLNNVPRDTTGPDGEYQLAIPNIGNHVISVQHLDHAFSPSSYSIYVDENFADMDFVNQTTHRVQGFAGGNCDINLGRSTWKFTSLDGCIIHEVETDLNGEYNIPLPAKQYLVTVDEFPNPGSYISSEVEAFFNAAVELDLRYADQELNFLYRPKPKMRITGFPDPVCDPEFTVLEQLKPVEITIEIFEGELDGCPVDTGKLVIIDQISDRGNESIEIPFSHGMATYTLVPGTPNISGDHLKNINITGFDSTQVNFENPAQFNLDALVTGVRPREQTFTTVTPQLPLMILRDPPGDASYSTVTQGAVNEVSTSFFSKDADGENAWGAVKLGVKFTTGLGFALETEIWGSVGGAYDVTNTSVTTEESILSIETSETFATSGNDLIIGDKGDVFVGAAMNLLYAAADVVSFENCQVTTDVDLVIANDGFATTYIYTEHHIRDGIMTQLEFLARNTNNPDSARYYRDQKNVWAQTLAHNQTLKEQALPYLHNISFGGEVSYDNSTTTSSTESISLEFTTEIVEEVAIEAGLDIGGVGFSGGYTATFRMDVGESETNTTTKSFTTGFHLEDDDPLDQFSVDIKKDPVYNTPVFDLVSGTTSCPHEEGTQPRDEPELVVVNPIQAGIAPGEIAEFTLLLRNTSQSQETRDYSLIFDQSSNPGGAKIRVGASDPSVPITYPVPYLGTTEVAVTVEQVGSKIFSYEGLLFRLESDCDGSIYSEAAISAFFVSPCSEVALFAPVDGWVINERSNVLDFHIKDYEETYLDQIIIEYSPAGVGSWSPLSVLMPDDLNPNSPNTTNIGTETSYNFLNIPDGAYDLRLKLTCGSASLFSQRATGIIDRQAPLVFGVPQPLDDHYDSNDEISLAFDEEVVCSEAIVTLVDMSTGMSIPASLSCFNNKMTIEPGVDLASYGDALFEVSVDGYKDIYGNTGSKTSWQFRTGNYVHVPNSDCGNTEVSNNSEAPPYIPDGQYKGAFISVDGTVPLNGTVNLQSVFEIDVNQGFEVKAGGTFVAETNIPCND